MAIYFHFEDGSGDDEKPFSTHANYLYRIVIDCHTHYHFVVAVNAYRYDQAVNFLNHPSTSDGESTDGHGGANRTKNNDEGYDDNEDFTPFFGGQVPLM